MLGNSTISSNAQASMPLLQPSMYDVYDRTMYGTPLTAAQLDQDLVNLNNAMLEDTTSSLDVFPTLNLDFVNSQVLDPRVTFTRASTATYYDGKTTALAEQNLIAYSENFNMWGGLVQYTAEAKYLAPDGVGVASKLVGYMGPASTPKLQGNITTDSLTKTFSIYAKSAGYPWFCLRIGSLGANFNLVTGTVGLIGVGCTPVMTDVGGGWWRCSITGIDSVAYLVRLFSCPQQPGVSYDVWSDSSGAGGGQYNGMDGAYIWGAQLERRGVPTTYVPTNGLAVSKYTPQLVTAAQNVPRFDYDPVSGMARGLLVEEQRTNTQTYSQDFSQGFYGKAGISGGTPWATVNSYPNSVIAPDGTVTGTRMVLSDYYANRIGNIYGIQTNSGFTGLPLGYSTLSIWLKTNNNLTIPARIGVVVYSGNVTGDTTGITVTPEWQRFSVTVNVTVTGNIRPTYFYSAVQNFDVSVWGAQLEVGSYATSYIPTSGSQVTRAWDSASMSGTNFSTWYNQREGTYSIEYTPNVVGYGVALWGMSGNVYSLTSIATHADTHIKINNPQGAAVNFRAGTFYVIAGTTNKFLVALKSYDMAAVRSTPTSITPSIGTVQTVTLPAFTRLDLGSNSAYYRKITYYPKRLNNNLLLGLTCL